jgi:hypothetical protein
MWRLPSWDCLSCALSAKVRLNDAPVLSPALSTPSISFRARSFRSPRSSRPGASNVRVTLRPLSCRCALTGRPQSISSRVPRSDWPNCTRGPTIGADSGGFGAAAFGIGGSGLAAVAAGFRAAGLGAAAFGGSRGCPDGSSSSITMRVPVWLLRKV